MALDRLFRPFRRKAVSAAGAIEGGAVQSQPSNIPRYPPFLTGFAYVNPQALLDDQQELMSKIELMLGLGEDFNRIVLPVLLRYAQFVHLLPASETHHHRGAGGLLRHGLEVGFYSAQFSMAMVFPYEGPPKNKYAHEQRWMLAAFLAGLTHDLGKPLSDMRITTEDGQKQWAPLTQSLDQWLIDNRIDRYFLHWNPSRVHKRHEKLTVFVFSSIVGNTALDFLSQYDDACLADMYEAVCGTTVSTGLSELVMRADQTSVAHDLRANRIDPQEDAYGVPIERYVLDAMRTLVSTNAWKINDPAGHSTVLVGNDGTFINWKEAIASVSAALSEIRVPGIPRDADVLADILIERGYATANFVPANTGEMLRYRYWPVEHVIDTDGMTAASQVLGLKLDAPQLIFGDGLPPASANVRLQCDKDSDDEHLDNDHENNSDMPATTTSEHGTQHQDSLASIGSANHQTEQADGDSNDKADDSTAPPDFPTLVTQLQATEPKPKPLVFASHDKATKKDNPDNEVKAESQAPGEQSAQARATDEATNAPSRNTGQSEGEGSQERASEQQPRKTAKAKKKSRSKAARRKRAAKSASKTAHAQQSFKPGISETGKTADSNDTGDTVKQTRHTALPGVVAKAVAAEHASVITELEQTLIEQLANYGAPGQRVHRVVTDVLQGKEPLGSKLDLRAGHYCITSQAFVSNLDFKQWAGQATKAHLSPGHKVDVSTKWEIRALALAPEVGKIIHELFERLNAQDDPFADDSEKIEVTLPDAGKTTPAENSASSRKTPSRTRRKKRRASKTAKGKHEQAKPTSDQPANLKPNEKRNQPAMTVDEALDQLADMLRTGQGPWLVDWRDEGSGRFSVQAGGTLRAMIQALDLSITAGMVRMQFKEQMLALGLSSEADRLVLQEK